jgi:hypothetical protein
MPGPLAEQFDTLAHLLRQTISLLEESEERFWIGYLQRGLKQVDDHHLAGATFILGCFGGQDTFSDVVIARHWQQAQPLQFENANARLHRLRNDILSTASAIASRRHW